MLCHHFMNYKIPADKTARDLHWLHNKLYEDL
jgi:hypothetical protein